MLTRETDTLYVDIVPIFSRKIMWDYTHYDVAHWGFLGYIFMQLSTQKPITRCNEKYIQLSYNDAIQWLWFWGVRTQSKVITLLETLRLDPDPLVKCLDVEKPPLLLITLTDKGRGLFSTLKQPANEDTGEIPEWFEGLWHQLAKLGKFTGMDKVKKPNGELYADVKKFIKWYEALRDGTVTDLTDYKQMSIQRKNIPAYSEASIFDALVNCAMSLQGNPGKAMVTFTKATRYSPVLNYLLRHPPMKGNVEPITWSEDKEWCYDFLERDGVPVRDDMILGFISRCNEYIEDNEEYIKEHQDYQQYGMCLTGVQMFTCFMIALREDKWDYKVAMSSVAIGTKPKKNMYWDMTLYQAYKKHKIKMGSCEGYWYDKKPRT